MNKGVHHLAVVVGDLDRSEKFYSIVLGLAVLRRWADAEGKPRSVWLDLGNGAFLAVERAAAQEPCRSDIAPGWHCVTLGIEKKDRLRWVERLAQHDVKVERESNYTVYTRDPDGNLVGLSHYPEERE